jgi:hypothetical protein
MIDATTAEQFRKDGYIIFRDFYDFENEIKPIQEGVRVIIELMAKKHRIEGPCGTAEEAMSQCYPKIIAVNRAWGGEIYDAVKQIPEFVALVASKRNVQLFEVLRPGAKAGIAAGGYGIRIDNPGEDKFRAWWHQEFPAQLRSNDGLVYWSPLLAVTQEMGPVQVAIGSHVEGFVPTYDDDAGLGRAGAYALRLQNEEKLLERYNIAAPLLKPSDLLILDFFILHQSGYNVSASPRWSMQLRYFNFRDPLGIKISWKGSFAAGEKFADIIPDIIKDKK